MKIQEFLNERENFRQCLGCQLYDEWATAHKWKCPLSESSLAGFDDLPEFDKNLWLTLADRAILFAVRQGYLYNE